MSILIILAYGIGLSMDAFAISVCKGIALKNVRMRDAVKVGAYFGIFQGLMPLLGYLLTNSYREYIETYDHWIAFALLFYIGGKMLWDSFHPDEKEDDNAALGFKQMVVMAFATSIDALAVGIAFSCDGMPMHSTGTILGIFAASAVICAATFILSAIGVKIGKLVENKLDKYAEITGGIVLILLGVKILLEHLTGITIF